jgi:hypothetical protein
MNDLVDMDEIVENEEVKQNLAAELLPIVADKSKVAAIIKVDPKAIDIWMEDPNFLAKLWPKIEESKDKIKAKLQQQTLMMSQVAYKKYMELVGSIKTGSRNINSTLIKALGQQYIEFRKLIKHDHKEPTVIEERQQTALLEELELLPQGERTEIMKGIMEVMKITTKPQQDPVLIDDEI